jgi:hypothetical protein
MIGIADELVGDQAMPRGLNVEAAPGRPSAILSLVRLASCRQDAAGRPRVGYRPLVAVSRAVWTTVERSSRSGELTAITTGIFPARIPKKV